MPRETDGLSRIVLGHAPLGTAPTLLTRRKDGSWAMVGITGAQVKGVVEPHDQALPRLFTEDPGLIVGFALIYSRNRVDRDILTPPITHVVGLGARWQTMMDSHPSGPVLDIVREPYEDGHLPSRLLVDPSGLIRNQSYWRGKPLRLVGFCPDERTRVLSLTLEGFLDDPSRAVGLMPVMADWGGTVATYPGAVREVVDDQRES